LDSEIQGDFNNFKGSVYHFRYAIRTLLTGQTEKVWFYKGNDLLARPANPVVVAEDDQVPTPIVSLAQHATDRDIWIQLKSTERSWTVSSLLDGNLLPNFICNAVHSEREQREWEVRLVTPALVAPNGRLAEFVQDPDGSPNNQRKLNAAINVARENLLLQEVSEDQTDIKKLRGIALEILRQLADSAPIRDETLIAEIEREIAYDYPDPRAVNDIANNLLGAMVDSAGAGPDAGITYDARWLAGVSGRSIGSRSLLSVDPAGACEKSVRSSLPAGWHAEKFVLRVRLHDALAQFVAAPETAFVLIGASGSGKSWSTAHWALSALQGQVRLLITGSDLHRWQTLDEILAWKLREFAPAGWHTHDFAHRLTAIRFSEPVTVIIDDLEVRPGGEAEVRQTLASLVDRCRELSFKLVVTAQEATWDLYRLGDRLSPNDIFKPTNSSSIATTNNERPQVIDVDHTETEDEGGAEQSTTRISGEAVAGVAHELSARLHSFALEGYTDEELANALTKQLGLEPDNALIQNLSTPFYVVLRTPFLLNLYLNQHRASPIAALRRRASVVVDALLDQRVERGLERVASATNLRYEELRVAFDALSEKMWKCREQGGLPRSELVGLLEGCLQPGIGGIVLDGLKLEGLIAFYVSTLRHQIAEPVVSDRIFAICLLRGLESGVIGLEDLYPEIDSGTVAAMLRAHENPSQVSTELLGLDNRWRRAICTGLAQCGSDDFRVLASLTSLARTGSSNLIPADAAEALGYLAARSRAALKWVARLYLGDWSFDRTVAERALGTTANLVPTQVAALIRLRLQRASKLNPNNVTERKERDKFLNSSLAPFLDIQNRNAAKVALRLLDRYGDLVRVDETTVDHRYVRDIDAVQGIVALILGPSELDSIIDDLSSPEVLARYRAARALKPVALDQPSTVVEALSDAIRAEEYPDVMNQLLWSAHRVATDQPGLLLEALEVSKAMDWVESSATAGAALSLLSDLTDHDSNRLLQTLPRSLDDYDPRVQALHAEALAFVWWRLAEATDEARSVLAELAKPDLDDVPTDFQVFALRGAAIAQLGLICIDSSVPSHELVGWHNIYSGMGRQFVFVWTDQFMERNASKLACHPEANLLLQVLKDAIVSEEAQEFDPLRRDLSNNAYLAANLCLEMLVHLSTVSIDPLTGGNGLPRGRQTLYFARRLLELGKVNNDVVAFAVKACEETDTPNAVTTATDERERCLAKLAGLNAIPEPALSIPGSGALLLFGGKDNSELIAQICSDEPSRFLNVVNEAIARSADLPTLYNLNQHTQRWDQLLVSEVYVRMFDLRRLGIEEAKELVTMMMEAMESMPTSSEQQEYQAVYSAIAAIQAGKPTNCQTIAEASNPIQQSHQWTLEIIDYHQESLSENGDPHWFAEVVCDRRGWWSNPYVRVEGDVTRFSKETLYMFPAVRLTLETIGRHYGESDPGGEWLAERKKTTELLERWGNVLSQHVDSRDDQARAYRAFQNRAKQYPRDERFWANYGLIALFNDDLRAAEQFLEKAVNTKWASESTKPSALYNLACVYSRQRRFENCKEVLTRCLALDSTKSHRNHLPTDSDFDNVRDQAWFAELAKP